MLTSPACLKRLMRRHCIDQFQSHTICFTKRHWRCHACSELPRLYQQQLHLGNLHLQVVPMLQGNMGIPSTCTQCVTVLYSASMESDTPVALQGRSPRQQWRQSSA